MTSHLTDEIKMLMALAAAGNPIETPGRIALQSFTDYKEHDHMLWKFKVPSGGEVAILMHKDDYKAMRDMLAAEQPYSKALNARPFNPDNPNG